MQHIFLFFRSAIGDTWLESSPGWNRNFPSLAVISVGLTGDRRNLRFSSPVHQFPGLSFYENLPHHPFCYWLRCGRSNFPGCSGLCRFRRDLIYCHSPHFPWSMERRDRRHSPDRPSNSREVLLRLCLPRARDLLQACCFWAGIDRRRCVFTAWFRFDVSVFY